MPNFSKKFSSQPDVMPPDRDPETHHNGPYNQPFASHFAPSTNRHRMAVRRSPNVPHALFRHRPFFVVGVVIVAAKPFDPN